MLEAQDKLVGKHDGMTETVLRNKEFYAQRNFYMCGFTLFLCLAINRHTTLLFTINDLEREKKSK